MHIFLFCRKYTLVALYTNKSENMAGHMLVMTTSYKDNLDDFGPTGSW
jgi:hypothetical protein